jgi:hypothetical protein
MTVATHPAALRELFELLSNHQLNSDDAGAMVERALLALDDPESYLTQYPDDEWLIEGYDLSYNLDDAGAASLRLLHWIVLDELGTWLVMGDKADEIAERIVDLLSEGGIAVQDPPPGLRTLDDYCEYFNRELSALDNAAPKELIEFDVGMNDETGFFIVDSEHVTRLISLAEQFKLRAQTTR